MKSFLSMICFSVMLCFSGMVSAVDFSPGSSTVGLVPTYSTVIDTGAVVATSEHQCSGCHVNKYNSDLTFSASPGGDPAFALVSPTSKADMFRRI